MKTKHMNNIDYKSMTRAEFEALCKTSFRDYHMYVTPAWKEAFDKLLEEEIEKYRHNIIRIKARCGGYNYITNNVHPVGSEGLKVYLDKHTTGVTYDPTRIRELADKHFNRK